MNLNHSDAVNGLPLPPGQFRTRQLLRLRGIIVCDCSLSDGRLAVFSFLPQRLKKCDNVTAILRLVVLALVPALVVSSHESRASDQHGELKDQSSWIRSLIQSSIAWYELFPDMNARTPMASKIVLRWINASRGQKGEDILVLWIHDGRPEA